MEKNAMVGTEQQTVVLYQSFGAGHIIPMTELGKILLSHGYNVTMVLIERPFWSSDSGAAVTGQAIASNPAINFHVLPRVPAPGFTSSKPPFFSTLQLLQRYNDELERFLRSVPRLHSLVTGMFSAYAADAAAKVGVPTYTFFASPAAFLAAVTQLPALLAGRTAGLKELGDEPLEFLGAPPMPASHLVKELLEHPEEGLCKAMVDVWQRNTDADGVLVNTFESLESRAVRALRDPRCVPGKVLPPIYCVGPVVGTGDRATERHECLSWLDKQPECSVVFLCFGSRGTLSVEQLREIAIGLDRSGKRFLWVLPTPAGTKKSRPEPHLPEGFLERTKDRGLLLTSWAPQVDVLRHPSTSAFVTHCGWNSVLEAITAGVPMLCWPLYSEQMFNKVLMTEDMGVGVEMAGYAAGFIKAEEVEAKVRLVMESEQGRGLRARVAARKKEADAALAEGGSSQAAFAQFFLDVKKLQEQRRIF